MCTLTGTSIKPKSHGNLCFWEQGVGGWLGMLPGSRWCFLENEMCSDWPSCLPKRGWGAASARHGQLSACTPVTARPLSTAQASPAGSWAAGCPLTTFRWGKNLSFFCICVVTLSRKLLRLISLDLPSEVLLQSVTFSKFGKEIESALFQGGSYEFRTVIYINVRQLNLFKIYNIVAICMNVIYKI